MAFKFELVSLIPVRNMSRAIRFYRQALGAKVRMRGTGAMRNNWASLRIGDADVWFVVPDRREGRRLAYSALVVKNIRKSVRQLRKAGVRFQRATRSTPETRIEGPIAFERYGASAFFQDSEGNLLMLMENPPD